MRILLVEDNEELCYSLAFQLKNEGFEVDVCHDGEDGLHFIEEQAHDLILLDRMLPLLDGLQAVSYTHRHIFDLSTTPYHFYLLIFFIKKESRDIRPGEL